MEAKQDGEVAKTYNARLRDRLAEFKDAEGLKLISFENGVAVIELTSGEYCFSIK